MRMLVCLTNQNGFTSTLTFGGLFARLTQAEVTLLRVSSSKKEVVQEENLQFKVNEVFGESTVKILDKVGKPNKVIMEEIKSGEYDLVVVRARKGIRLHHRLGKKVGRMVAREARTSVLVVKEAPETVRQVLICTGGAVIAEPVIEAGAKLAKIFDAQATVLYVTGAVPTMYSGLEEIEETLPELLQTDTTIARHLRRAVEILAQFGIEGKLKLRQGVVDEEIIDEAEMGGYDLIVLGASNIAGNISSLVLGDVTSQVVNHASQPVLVVRTPIP